MKKAFLRISAILLCIVMLCGTIPPAAADAGDPVLYTNKWAAAPGESFSLSWNESGFDGQLGLWKRTENSGYEFVASVPQSSAGYPVTLNRTGSWYFCLAGTRNGNFRQSDEVGINVCREGGKKASHAGDPVIYSNKTAVAAGEHFSLSWYEDRADGELGLWKRRAETDYEFVATVPKHSDGYDLTLDRNGTWYFSLMSTVNGQVHQSDEFRVLVGASEEEAALRLMEEKGMNNTWNLLFVICEQVDIDGFRKSFSSAEIAEIEMYAGCMKYTMEGITEGRMQIGTVETVRISTPLTSVSGNKGTDMRTLTYGPGGDLNFDDLLESRDVNAVIVYAPISGLTGTEGWLGLAPFIVGRDGTQCLALILNAVDMNRTFYEMDGISYLEEITGIVHELLHCVEYNSLLRGWDGYEALHDVEENGYRFEHGNLLWYRDLTRDRIRNGHRGFRSESFYVNHR